ncbi:MULTISPECIES: DUF4148 domain-containing protein [unclassified Polaromonas]|uniref:DUF4148 domain-containing protein n=1 Tax=unclassified Polaromonas TaxID=2638319 RepID=UPI0018CAF84F|nr:MULTISPECIES: DUF4148 domain-containing protein [unclassified Polaromonas]MBG6073984.1 hypothetical protein [Polaromonas sp. CG_9.7]MBG6115992.1 hypothetical protein [Polaromonas sp. CG_9.2]MDH6182899.1 hypothetical protein [Polaromonas sp. CG_23.6]
MNTTKILASTIIAMASAMAGNAFAQAPDHVYPPVNTMSSSVTRAEVQSELAQAQKNGVALRDTTDHGYAGSMAAMNGNTSKTRAEVHAELHSYMMNGGGIPYDHS